ncbi:MAG TPA: hypothetical protein VJ966_06155 [Actinomycetes bacterium]|nr:hypothetical protein [Actinomycetes bacterium]
MQQEQVAGEVAAWLGRRLPEGWFAGPPEVTADADEILVVGSLPEGGEDAGESPVERARRFREETREPRVLLAAQLERRFRRRVSWGVDCGGERLLFTTLSVPVMTRLRLPERRVLDTLIDAGVARSRSDAIAWCVRLVGTHEADWIRELRTALVAVKRIRAQGPNP